MQETAKQVLDALGVEDNPLLQVAKELEHIALTDDYFISRKLYPNVDFYSGIILEAIGFPTSMFTAIFALSRTVGWIAQWKEMIADPQKKLGRPACEAGRCASTRAAGSVRGASGAPFSIPARIRRKPSRCRSISAPSPSSRSSSSTTSLERRSDPRNSG